MCNMLHCELHFYSMLTFFYAYAHCNLQTYHVSHVHRSLVSTLFYEKILYGSTTLDDNAGNDNLPYGKEINQ